MVLTKSMVGYKTELGTTRICVTIVILAVMILYPVSMSSKISPGCEAGVPNRCCCDKGSDNQACPMAQSGGTAKVCEQNMDQGHYRVTAMLVKLDASYGTAGSLVISMETPILATRNDVVPQLLSRSPPKALLYSVFLI